MPFPSPIPQRRIEALALRCTAAALYGHLGFAGSPFAIRFFLPDIGILGYLHSDRGFFDTDMGPKQAIAIPFLECQLG